MENTDLAAKHLRDILAIALEYSEAHSAIVVFDTQSDLAKILTQAYKISLPKARFIPFDATPAGEILDVLKSLNPLDLVVLIQSTSFRLDAFRIRVELFKRAIKVIEHPHLANILASEIDYYLDSLAYDSDYYRKTGRALKSRIDQAKCCILESGGESLIFDSRFRPAKMNIGDYSSMQNVGSQFPIGEVFTEAQDLEAVHGRVRISAFGDTRFLVNKPEKPITLEVTKGRVINVSDSNPEFNQILKNIRADEGEIWLRELGFGLNRAFTRDRLVSDIGTYERMCGIHLSLGAKHALYKNPLFNSKQTKHHVDVFAVTESVILDHEVVYQNGSWQI